MNKILEQAERDGLSRRVFLRNLLLTAGSVPAAHLLTACGGGGTSPGVGGTGGGSAANPNGGIDPTFQSAFASMGPLQAADANGIQLPMGFSSRVLAVANQAPITSQPGFLWHTDPDGGATFSTDDGGWIYVSNSEARDGTTFGQTRDQAEAATLPFTPSLDQLSAISDEFPNIQFPVGASLVSFRGGVSALRFNANGDLVDAYACERGTTTNCSGGATPWGTWINGEEIEDGYMFECSPLRDGGEPVRLDRFGRKGHEMVTVDPDDKAIYHTEDAGGNDRFYRTVFTDAAWPDGGRPDMSQGLLQVLQVPAGSDAARSGPTPIVWLNAIDDGTPQPEVYDQVASTVFAGNEGVWYLNGFIFFSTKTDDTIWAIDVEGGTIEVIYEPTDGPIGSPVDPNEPAMVGVDNIAMTLDGEMLVVEDGGDMRCMVLLPDRTTIPLLRLPGDPSVTEVTGVAIGPTGNKVYVSGQRSLPDPNAPNGAPNTSGVTFEITMPFQVRVERPLAAAMPAVF